MWSATRIAFLSLFLCLPAQAQEIQIGSTLACDTEQQVQRFVSLYRGDAADAAKTVNAEAKDPTACDMVAAAYVSGPEIATVRTQSRTYRIVRILVVGIVTAAGIAPAEPSMFYSFVPVDERGA